VLIVFDERVRNNAQSRGDIDLRATAVPIGRYAHANPIQQNHQFGLSVGGCRDDPVPLLPKLAILAFQECSHQFVFALEMPI